MPAPIVPIVTAAVARLVAKHGVKAVKNAVKKIPPPPPGSIKGIRTGGRPSAIRTKAQKKVEKKALDAANKPAKGATAGAARAEGQRYQAKRDYKTADMAAQRVREGIKNARRGKGK
jgi:hypothetical protein